MSVAAAATLQPGRPVVILVIGMHRSGTSALGGVLNLLGVAMSGDRLPPSDDNRKGFFENKRLFAFHDKLLAEFGSRWEDPLPLSEECLHSPNAHAAARELATLFQEEFSNRPLVLIKDPRMCRFLPVWIEGLSSSDRNIVVILWVRHPLEVAASLQHRDSLSRAHALVLWLQHVLAAEHTTRSLVRCVVIYDDLLRDWRSVVHKIGETLGLAWPRETIRVAHEIDQFLSSELRHHRSTEGTQLAHDALHSLCSRAWSALRLLSVDNRDGLAWVTLDEVAHEFEGAMRILSPLVASLDGSLVKSSRQLAECAGRIDSLTEALAERDARIERRNRGAAEHGAAAETPISALTDKSRSLGDALSEREDDVAELRQAWRAAQEREIALQGASHALEVELAETRSDLASLKQQLAAITGSTVWRATWPLRYAGSRLPRPVRRALRGAAKFGWWTVTLQLSGKLAERRRFLAQARAVTPVVTYGGHVIENAAIEKMKALFDSDWYRNQYSKIVPDQIDPFEHYIFVGLSRGLNPNCGFDELWYRENNPDIVATGRHGFEHFITQGARDGRLPCSVFDFDFYRLTSGLRSASNIDTFAHYIRHGHRQGIAASPITIPSGAANAELGEPEDAFNGLSVTVGIVIYKETPEQVGRIVRSAKAAIARCAGVVGNILVSDNGGAFDRALLAEDVTYLPTGQDEGVAVAHNKCMQDAFAVGTEVYIIANPNGAFHPDCIRALLAMNRSQKCCALIEALQFPEEHPKVYDPVTLRTGWSSGACLLLPRLIWETTGGFDENFYRYLEDVDISWTAHRLGFQTLICPGALFHQDISESHHEAWRRRETLISGRYLAYKWGAPGFVKWTESCLCEEGFIADLRELPPLDDLPIIEDGANFADFSNGFNFSPVRW